MKVNGWAYFTQSLPTKLYLPSLGSHSIKLRGLKNENLGTSSFVLICWLPERIRSVFSHIVRKDTSNLLEPSPASRWYDYTYYFFSLSIIFIYLESRVLSSLLYSTYTTILTLPRASAPPTTTMTMALPPPRPKSCQNMMRTQAASAKNISANS